MAETINDVMHCNVWTLTEIPAAVDKACEYSDEPQALRDWLDVSGPITAQIVGARKMNPEDPDDMLRFNVTIGDYTFPFYESIRNRAAWFGEFLRSPFAGRLTIADVEEGEAKAKSNRRAERTRIVTELLYSVLCSIRSDIFCDVTFSTFCDEYGYDTDSRKAHACWERCHEHAHNLKELAGIDPDSVECLPS